MCFNKITFVLNLLLLKKKYQGCNVQVAKFAIKIKAIYSSIKVLIIWVNFMEQSHFRNEKQTVLGVLGL